MSTVYPPNVAIRREATLSEDGLYRYSLVRRWGTSGNPAQFVMLNPSTADDANDDPTIRRCVGFARSLGCVGIVVVNLYAYRATKPADLWKARDPVGPKADVFLSLIARRNRDAGAPLIAAWGANAKPDRVSAALEVIRREGGTLTALGVTKDGAPRHPLYIPADAPLMSWPTCPTPPGGSDGGDAEK